MHDTQEHGTTVWFMQFIAILALWATGVWAAEDPIVTKKVEGTFSEVLENVSNSIVGKGINIAHVLPAGDMLGRTGSDFGYEQSVYVDAESIEFCSVRISHMLARAHPDNIVLCPFTISVYVLRTEPDQVRISYRIPTGRPGSEEAANEVVALIESIIEDATW